MADLHPFLHHAQRIYLDGLEPLEPRGCKGIRNSQMEMQAPFLVSHGPIAFPAAPFKIQYSRKPAKPTTQPAGKDAVHDCK